MTTRPAPVLRRTALPAAVVLTVVGALLRLVTPGWLLIIGGPVAVVVLVWGWVVLTRALRRGGPADTVPRRVPWYPLLAWTWGLAVLCVGLLVPDGGDAEPFAPPLLHLLGRAAGPGYAPVEGFATTVALPVAALVPLVVSILLSWDRRPAPGPPVVGGTGR